MIIVDTLLTQFKWNRKNERSDCLTHMACHANKDIFFWLRESRQRSHI